MGFLRSSPWENPVADHFREDPRNIQCFFDQMSQPCHCFSATTGQTVSNSCEIVHIKHVIYIYIIISSFHKLPIMKHPHTQMEKRPLPPSTAHLTAFSAPHTSHPVGSQAADCGVNSARPGQFSLPAKWSGPLLDPNSSELASQKPQLSRLLQERLLKFVFWESGCELESKSMKFQQTFSDPKPLFLFLSNLIHPHHTRKPLPASLVSANVAPNSLP